MLRKLPALLLLVLSASAFAAQEVTITFPDSSEHIVFESANWPTADPPKSITFKVAKINFALDTTNKTDRIFVVDTAANKLASKTLAEIKDNNWTMTKDDFKDLYKVKVEVSTPKGPIAAASVMLADAADERTDLVDPSTNGTASFMFVKAGEVNVAVTYKANGQAKDPVKQSFTVGGDKDATLKVAVPDGDAVAAGTAPAGNTPASDTGSSKEKGKDSGDKKGDEKVDTGNGMLGNLFMTLIGFAVVAGVGYWIFLFMKKNPDRVKDTMTKLGADVPKPYDPATDPANDPNPVAPIKPQPLQQIILDQSSAPAVAPVPMSATPAAAPTVTGIPKLIAGDGSAFQLPEGETVVGREFGNGLVVPDDTVSRKHATLLKMGTSVELHDHGSTNGTWVNGVKVSGSQTLRPGDSVRFGKIEYRFEG
ncbi:MAG: FHA domain-containing protein [Armatimonadetes bacterium]|nr:FHA domain-containing protein [Armatimonadota bacterium]